MSKWGTLLAAIALFSSAAWADSGVSARNKLVELTGTTKDVLGRPLANVDLELSASNGRLIARAHSDRRGLFTFSNVPAGVYALLARHTDFKPNTTIVSIGRSKGEVEIYLEALEPLSMELRTQPLNQARNDLSPQTGSSVYRFTAQTISELPEADNTSLPNLLILAPGVNQDIAENGGFHVRGVDGQIQYRINGIMVPDLNSAITPVFNSRFVQSLDLLDGTLPAQFGYRTAGVIDIHTKSGCIDGASHVSMFGGQRATYQPSFELGGCEDGWDYYLTGQFLQNDRGVEPPTAGPQAKHDQTQQGQGFAYVSRLLSPVTRLTLVGGLAMGNYQIPDTPYLTPQYTLHGVSYYPPLAINDNQLDGTFYGIVALQGSLNSAMDYQLAVFTRYFQTNFYPDPIGDLIYQGVSTRLLDSSFANGAQGDVTYRLNSAHTLRSGFYFNEEGVESRTTSLVFPADADGNQTSSVPEGIVDNYNRLTFLGGFYLQDQWRLTEKLDVNYGFRWDISEAFVSKNVFQPRIGAVYHLTNHTSLHAGYAHYFTPPSLEEITQKSIEEFNNTTNAVPNVGNENVQPEQDDYFDAGILQEIVPGLKIGVDSYFDLINQWLDEAQLGNSLIFSPLNYRNGRSWGVELSSSYQRGNLDAWFNFSYEEQEVNYVSSMQFSFDPDELAYLDRHYIPIDQTQLFTIAAGASYRWHDWLFDFDGTWNRGLPYGFANLQTLPSYLQVNIGLARNFVVPHVGKVICRAAMVNLFDRVYLIRAPDSDVNIPAYGPRRAGYVGITVPLAFVHSSTGQGVP
jgi:outer membrane receptor protein involved in Fe transport